MVKNNTFENFVLLSLQSTVGQTKNFQAKRTKSHNIWSAIIFGSAPSLRRTTGSPRFADFKLVPARALVPWRWPKGTRLWGRDCGAGQKERGSGDEIVSYLQNDSAGDFRHSKQCKYKEKHLFTFWNVHKRK